MFPGNGNASECWNCGKKGHHFSKCHKYLDLIKIAAKKAEYFKKKGERKTGTQRVLYELVAGLCELCDINQEPKEYVKAFFGDLMDDDNYSTSSSDTDEIVGIPKESIFTTIGEPDEPGDLESDVDF